MKVEGVYLDALGVFLPQWVGVDQAIKEGLVEEGRYKEDGHTGTHVAGDTPALDMAVTAARRAIEQSGVDVESIGSFVYCATQYQAPEGSYAPGYVMRELGLEPVPAFYLRQGCNGMLSALEMATYQLKADVGIERVLLNTGDNFGSPHIDRWRFFGDSYILADAGAAVLVSRERGFAEVRSLNTGVLPELERMHRGRGSLLPREVPQDEVKDMAAEFAENEMPLAELMEKITTFDLGIIHRSLVDAGVNAADITKVIPINGDRGMIEYSLMAPLGLPMSRSSFDFGRSVGHAGAADLVISLDHLLRTGELQPGDHVLLTSQGPGWMCSSTVLRILGAP